MIDTHSHLFEDEFINDIDSCIERCKENNVNKVILVGFSNQTNLKAQELSKFFKDKGIEIVYSSPYRRAIDTAKIAITKDTDIKIITDDALKEAIFWFWDVEDEEKKRLDKFEWALEIFN